MAAAPANVSSSSNLVVFYSREGATRNIALKIAAFIFADVLEVKEDKTNDDYYNFHANTPPTDYKHLSFIRLCYKATTQTPTPIKTEDFTGSDLENYKTVYIGSPVHVTMLDFLFPHTLKQGKPFISTYSYMACREQI